MPLTIGNQITIEYNGNLAIIPESLIVESAGAKFIKLNPTNIKIANLITGKTGKKNPSLSHSANLLQMKRDRDDACAGGADNLANLFGEEPTAKKKKCAVDKEAPVAIVVNGIPVRVLPFQHRSTEDLAVELKEDSLEAVFDAIRETATDVAEGKRPYNKKSVSSQDISEASNVPK